MKSSWLLTIVLLFAAAGCGTSKWTDTSRSATEQLLITDAMDRAVSDLDFRALAGKKCYIDSKALARITDSEYLVSCMRQHMLANGCLVMDAKGDADYMVEVRAGAVGTDRHDLLYGVPAVNIPSVLPLTGIPSQIPEMPLVKKTDQRAVVKLSVFAYNQKTGRPIWQSGAVPEESDAKAVWVLGAGPFQRGTIYNGMEFAGNKIDIPLIDLHQSTNDDVSVADEAYFVEPEEKSDIEVANAEDAAADGALPATVVPAAHSEPAAKGKPETVAPTPAAANEVQDSATEAPAVQGNSSAASPLPQPSPAPPATASEGESQGEAGNQAATRLPGIAQPVTVPSAGGSRPSAAIQSASGPSIFQGPFSYDFPSPLPQSSHGQAVSRPAVVVPER